MAQAIAAGAQIVYWEWPPSLTLANAIAHFVGAIAIGSTAVRDGGSLLNAARRPPRILPTRLQSLPAWMTSAADRGNCRRRQLLITKASQPEAVDAPTVKEQLLYEIHDPAAYLTPDVVADISEAEVAKSGATRASDGVADTARRT